MMAEKDGATSERGLRRYLQSCCTAEGQGTDLQLVCQDGEVWAHRFLVAGALPGLAALQPAPCPALHTTILLPDYNRQQLETARDLLYLYGDPSKLHSIIGITNNTEQKEAGGQVQVGELKENDKSQKSENLENVHNYVISDIGTMNDTEIDFTDSNLFDEEDDLAKICVKEEEDEPELSKGLKHSDINSKLKSVRMRKDFTCKECGYKAKNSGILKIHMKMVHGDDSFSRAEYTCHLCGFSTPLKWHLNLHTKKVHEKVKDKVQLHCTQCDYITTEAKSLKVHVRGFHEKRKVRCQIAGCDYEGYDESAVRRHRKKTHEGITYPCEQCDYKAGEKNSLKKHVLAVHFGVKQGQMYERHITKPYSCDHCDYRAGQNSQLKRHIDSVHLGIKIKCSQCDHETNSELSLKRHIQKVHEGVKYMCDRCDFQCSSQYYLNTHIDSEHKGIKFQCDQCGYQAKRKHGLLLHVKSVHFGITFKCEQCPKEFSLKGNLDIHTKNVHDFLKYPCNFCEYKATSPEKLLKHISWKHKGNVQ